MIPPPQPSDPFHPCCFRSIRVQRARKLTRPGSRTNCPAMRACGSAVTGSTETLKD